MARLYYHYDNIALTYPPNMDTSYSHSSIFSDAELKSSLNMTYPWVRTGVDGCNAVHKTTGGVFIVHFCRMYVRKYQDMS